MKGLAPLGMAASRGSPGLETVREFCFNKKESGRVAGLTDQMVAEPSRPDFQGSPLDPRTGTGTVPKLAGEDACATRAPAFLVIAPRK